MKTHMMRGIAALLLIVCFVGETSLSAYAVDNTDTIQPYYVGASGAGCSLSIQSGKATCKGYVYLYSGYTSSLTLNLQKYSNGAWKTQKTWTGSGKMIKKPYYVSSGYKYRATFNVKVYNSSGTLVDNITKISATKP